MIVAFQPVRVPNGKVPNIRYLQTVAAPAASLILGAVLAFTAGEVDTAGADPASIVGVALAAGNSAPGFNAANSPTVSTGRLRKIAVAVADRVTVFAGTLTNGSSTRIAPVQADLGASYGITAYSNIWTVDKNKTAGSARVKVVDIDTLNNLVYFKFLEANLALP